MSSKTMTVAEAAAALGKSERWVRKLCDRGEGHIRGGLKATRIGKRKYAIDVKSVEREKLRVREAGRPEGT